MRRFNPTFVFVIIVAIAVVLSSTAATAAPAGPSGFGAAAGTIVLSENFDAAIPPALPAGWASVDVSGTHGDWRTKDGTHQPPGLPAASPPNLAYFNSKSAKEPATTRLSTTSGVDLSTATYATLSLAVYHDSNAPEETDYLQPQVSVDGGATWQNVGERVYRYSAADGWTTHTLDFTSYAGLEDVRIGFLGASARGRDCHIDDIKLVADVVQNPALTLAKSADTSTYRAPGDVIGYTFVLTNSGDVPLTGPFTVVDDLATDEACPPTGTLLPGLSVTCTASYTVTQADVQAGSVTNSAYATGSFAGNPVTSNTDTATVLYWMHNRAYLPLVVR